MSGQRQKLEQSLLNLCIYQHLPHLARRFSSSVFSYSQLICQTAFLFLWFQILIRPLPISKACMCPIAGLFLLILSELLQLWPCWHLPSNLTLITINTNFRWYCFPHPNLIPVWHSNYLHQSYHEKGRATKWRLLGPWTNIFNQSLCRQDLVICIRLAFVETGASTSSCGRRTSIRLALHYR